MDEPAIRLDDLIEPTLARFPAVAAVFARRGMACVGCDMARFDRVGDAARAYHEPPADLVDELAVAAGRNDVGPDREGE